MLKSIIVLSLLVSNTVLAATVSPAQKPNQSAATIQTEEKSVSSGQRVGAVAGVAISDVVGTPASGTTSRTGFVGGGVYETGDQTAFETGILFRRIGTKINSGFGAITLNLDYITIPLDAKFYLNSSRTVYLKAGVLASILVGKSANVEGYGDVSMERLDTNAFDAGPNAGAGLLIPMQGKISMSIEGSHYRGLTKINGSGSETVSNSSGQITVGILSDI